MWAAGLVIGELLLCEAVLQGDTEIEQLSLIENVIGSPLAKDIEALASLDCPELESWNRNGLEQGRPNKFERKFQKFKSQNLIKFLASFLTWDPRLRPTASEALGYDTGACAEDANAWWREAPPAAPNENLIRHIAIHGQHDSNEEQLGP
jgi:cyclin-dependent kinase 10